MKFRFEPEVWATLIRGQVLAGYNGGVTPSEKVLHGKLAHIKNLWCKCTNHDCYNGWNIHWHIHIYHDRLICTHCKYAYIPCHIPYTYTQPEWQWPVANEFLLFNHCWRYVCAWQAESRRSFSITLIQTVAKLRFVQAPYLSTPLFLVSVTSWCNGTFPSGRGSVAHKLA